MEMNKALTVENDVSLISELPRGHLNFADHHNELNDGQMFLLSLKHKIFVSFSNHAGTKSEDFTQTTIQEKDRHVKH